MHKRTRIQNRPSKKTAPSHKRQIKDVLIVVKVSRSLADAIDQEGERVGLTRSAIVRGTLLEKFRDSMSST